MPFFAPPASQRHWQVLHRVIFEAETPARRVFDRLLILSIILSVIVVMLDSVTAIRKAHGHVLYRLE